MGAWVNPKKQNKTKTVGRWPLSRANERSEGSSDQPQAGLTLGGSSHRMQML